MFVVVVCDVVRTAHTHSRPRRTLSHDGALVRVRGKLAATSVAESLRAAGVPSRTRFYFFDSFLRLFILYVRVAFWYITYSTLNTHRHHICTQNIYTFIFAFNTQFVGEFMYARNLMESRLRSFRVYESV